MAEIDIKKINDSDAPKQVKEVYEKLKHFLDDQDRKDWKKDVYKRGWEIAWGKSDALWTEDERKQMTDKGQIPISINDLSKGIQGSCAVATANKPGINVKPIGSNDLYLAELVKRGFDFVWWQNRGKEVLFDIAKESKTGSLGVLSVEYDKAKNKIIFYSDDPLTFYFDKKSRKSDKSDSDLIKAHLITKEYAKDNYDVTDADLEFKPMPDDEEESGKSKEGNPNDGYIDAQKITDTKDTADPKELVWEIEAYLIKKEKEYSLNTVMPDGEAVKIPFNSKKEALQRKEEIELQYQDLGIQLNYKEQTVEVRKQYVIVGKKLISEETNPFGLDSDGDPVVPKILVPHDRSNSGFFTCPTYRAIEITKSRNKRRMQTIYVISKNIEAPIVTAEGYKWVTDKVHGDVLVMPKDAAFPTSRLLPGTTSAELVAMEQRDEAAIDEEYDMNDVMKGKTPPGVEAYRAISVLQDAGGMMSTPFIGVLENGIEKMAKVIFSLMLKYWPRSMWERLIDPEEMTSWQPDKEREIDKETGEPKQPEAEQVQNKWAQALDALCPEDPTAKKKVDIEGLDIRIIAGSTTPTNRMAKRMDAQEMVDKGIYDAEAALEYVDDPNKDKIVARMRQKEQMAMQAGMMKGAGK